MESPRTGLPHSSSLPPGGVSLEARRWAVTYWLATALKWACCLVVICLGILVLAGFAASKRELRTLVAPSSLQQQQEEFFGRDKEGNVDDLLLFVHTVLPLMHRIDDRGAPDLPLLRGMVAPDLYNEVQGEAARARGAAAENLMVQTLVVTRVDDVVADPEVGRISAYVRGYLATIIQASDRQVILPYRAEVLLDLSAPSRLNRFPFVMTQRNWRIGNDAISWDSERAAEQPTQN